jgi:hypothetical protein
VVVLFLEGYGLLVTATRTSVPPHPSATSADAPVAAPALAIAPAAWAVPTSDRARVGVGAGAQGIDGFDWGDTPGWYLNWSPIELPGQWPQISFLRIVYPLGGKYSPDLGSIRRTAAANPGTLWLISN